MYPLSNGLGLLPGCRKTRPAARNYGIAVSLWASRLSPSRWRRSIDVVRSFLIVSHPHTHNRLHKISLKSIPQYYIKKSMKIICLQNTFTYTYINNVRLYYYVCNRKMYNEYSYKIYLWKIRIGK